MGGICGAIGITGREMALRGPSFSAARSHQISKSLFRSSNRVGAPLNVVTELEERSSFVCRFAFPDFAIFPKVVPTMVGVAASEV